ncbi:MAG TPA: GAF domain-containing sensor histidine kinase [Acidimicrobiia bacterium]|nr:GAF domain-containing sensor histidine kinase [Acidimicrobiia bacterium]
MTESAAPSPPPPGWESLLARLVDLTSEAVEPRQLMHRVAALIRDVTGTDACFVHLLDEPRHRLVLAGATPPFDHVAGTIELELGEGVAGWVAEHSQPAIVEDKWHDARYKYIPALRGEDFTSMVSLPLVRPGPRVVGVFNLHTRAKRQFTTQELAALSSVAGLLAGIVENRLLYHRLAEREAELERFAARTVELQELERRRLAGELHDGVSQRVVSLRYHLSAAEELLLPGQPDVAAELRAAQALAGATLDETRRAITGLRPSMLDDLGLATALNHLAHSVPGVEVDVDLDRTCSLAPHVETAFYRIAQEALQNVAKHALATRVWVALRPQAGSIRLLVADDGRGFDVARERSAGRRDAYGLVGIAERAALVGADVELSSAPGAGTAVIVTVPCAGAVAG